MRLIYWLMFSVAVAYFLLMIKLFYGGILSPTEFVTFLGIIPLGIIALFQEQLKRWFFAPEVIIEFRHEEPFSIKTEMTEVPTGVHVCFCYYFRFHVYNKGKSQAKNCEAILEEFWEEENGKWQKSKTFQPVNLIWSNNKSNSEFLHINPLARWFCDIGSIRQQQGRTPVIFNFETAFRPNSQPKKLREGLKPNEKCKIKIVVYSENAAKVEREFLIQWSGQWQDKPEGMFKEITIK